MRHILVAYYSFTKNTEQLAQSIAAITSGDLRALAPEKEYSFHYNTAAKEARGEIARGYCPVLISGNEPIDAFDTVFIGSPNWFKTIAPPVLSFIRAHSFADKTVIPFCAHGGGGMGEIESTVQGECHGARFIQGFASSGGESKEDIARWLRHISIVK